MFGGEVLLVEDIEHAVREHLPVHDSGYVGSEATGPAKSRDEVV